MFEGSSFDYDHIPIDELTLAQHIAGATLFFRKAMRIDPEHGLEHAKELWLYRLQQWGLGTKGQQVIIERAAKAAREMESN